MNFAPHEQRVIEEHRELTERHNKLTTFFHSPTFAGLSEAEATRLRCQTFFMAGYADVLAARIEAMMRAHAYAQGSTVSPA